MVRETRADVTHAIRVSSSDAMRTPAIDRRAALRLLFGGGAAALGGYSVAVEPAWLDVTEHDIPVPGLPRGLAGYRIAQLTDIHSSALGRVHDRIFAALRARSIQLVVITGDAVDRESALPVLTELCHGLAANGCAMLATLGNWEHWGEVPRQALRAAYERGGARLLGDESILLEAGVTVTATDDSCSGNADVATALRVVPRADIRLFLSHAPGIFDELPPDAPSFHLGLAGHTHGGQICALGGAVWVPPGSGRFRAGMYATAHGPLYVSRGVGTSVVPARFTCRPELPIFRLVQG
jgi:predicted MPP superfamily phosphohydrolase